MSLVFLAISRTGDDPLRHDMFEVAAVHRTEDGPALVERVQHWAIRPERLAAADPVELERSQFFDRVAAWEHNGHPVVAIDPNLGTTTPTSHHGVARTLARMTLGAQLVTLGIDREAEFVAEFMRSQREPAGWVGHYDVAAAAAGGLAGYAQGWAARDRVDPAGRAASSVDLGAAALPLDPFRLAAAIGATPAGAAVSALTRAFLARDMYDIVTAPLAGDGGRHEADPAPVDPAAPTAAMPAQGPRTGLPPGVEPLAAPVDVLGLSTGDPALDAVIRNIDQRER